LGRGPAVDQHEYLVPVPGAENEYLVPVLGAENEYLVPVSGGRQVENNDYLVPVVRANGGMTVYSVPVEPDNEVYSEPAHVSPRSATVGDSTSVT